MRKKILAVHMLRIFTLMLADSFQYIHLKLYWMLFLKWQKVKKLSLLGKRGLFYNLFLEKSYLFGKDQH